MSGKKESNLTFEAALSRLEQIVRSMERGDVALEESMKLFEEGSALVRQCGKLLDEAELKVVKLSKGPDGEPVEGAFEEDV